MNILIVSHEYPPIGGGGANACMHLSKEYVRAGHNVTVVTVWYKDLSEEEISDGVRLIRVHAKRKYKEHCNFIEMLDYLLKARKTIDELERESCFDICQVFFAIPSGPLGYYLKKKCHVPYIIRFGGGDIPGFQSRFRVLYKIIGPFEKIILKNANALVANSMGLKKLALMFFDKKEIQIVSNGVDIQMYQEKNQAENIDSTINLLFVSRLIERKGLQFFLPYLKEISNNVNKRIHLTVVGDGPFRSQLEQIVKQEEIQNLVTFEGQRNKSELSAFYRNADIFVLPSSKEGMPNVVLEAMASGLPIVMTPCEGSDELIYENGYALPIEEFSEKLIYLINNDEKRIEMGKKSRQLVEERFKWEQIAGQYLELMKNVVGT